jgi:AcrR family transcriptional regulator/DNA-binding MarR family transcriptional regulator
VSAVASRARAGGGAGRNVERRRTRGNLDRSDGRTGVVGIQRARMIAALVDVVGERGAGGVTVEAVVGRSGVSRRTFYELFEDREDCFLAAFELAVGRGAGRVVPAFDSARPWRERIRAGLEALLGYLDDEPGLGALCVVDALGASRVVLERRARVVGALVDAVHEGRHEARAAARPTRLTAEGVVGAVLGVLHARLSEGHARGNGGSVSTASLLGPLMAMIVLPYLGQAAAAREAARPVPPPRRRAAASSASNLLGELDMRLTYRTVRVLLAIGELAGSQEPGPSNRRVSEVAGVSDQGQISKLLARLEHLGLIENTSAGQHRGEPNIWRLTAKGTEIERTIRPQATPTGTSATS